MKSTLPLLVSLLLLLGGCAPDKVATVTPQTPKIGDELSIVYNSSTAGATLKGDTAVTAEILLLRDETTPLVAEIPMIRQGNRFTATYKLADEKARAVLVQFVAGEKKDTVTEAGRALSLYGSDGKPLKGGTAMLGMLSLRGNYVGFTQKKDTVGARELFRKEQTLYPDSWNAYSSEWSIDLPRSATDEQKAAVRKSIEAFLEKHKGDEKAAFTAIPYLDLAGGKQQADSIREEMIAAHPNGSIAEKVRRSAVNQEANPERRLELMEAFLKDFPQQGENLEGATMTLLSFQLAAKKYDNAIATLQSIPKPNASLCYRVSSALLDAGVQKQKALELAKQAVDLAKGDTEKPPYMRKKDWEENHKYMLAMVDNGYAKALLKNGKAAEAEKVYEDAVLVASDDGELYEGLVSACLANKKLDKAVSVASKAVQTGAASDNLLAAYRKAYIGLKGSEKGFAEALSNDRAAATELTKAKILKERVNQPAVDFALKGLDGNTVKLSDLKGKVVVVDFWATWCGPCKMSFPFLQKIYEKYQSNPDVKILALDTWENVSGKEREDLVKKFMADNKYTFPVLFDEDFVTKYGVTGIPTKFIIDKKGMIQVKSIGFDNGPKMVDELTIAIDLMLGAEFYKN
jgi:thiol-disulfide isomerase/thioredoxin